MALHRYFADLADGTTLEWSDYVQGGQIRSARGISNDGRTVKGYIEGKGWIAVTRVVQMKAHPSRHECDDRCMYATGRTMKCECSCGGANHGKGSRVMICEAA